MESGDSGNLILGAQTSGTEIKLSGLAVDNNCRGVDIRRPSPVGMPFRVTDITSEPG